MRVLKDRVRDGLAALRTPEEAKGDDRAVPFGLPEVHAAQTNTDTGGKCIAKTKQKKDEKKTTMTRICNR